MAMKNNPKTLKEKRGKIPLKMTPRKKSKNYEMAIKAGNFV